MTVLIVAAVIVLWAGVVLIIAACIDTNPPRRAWIHVDRPLTRPHPN